MPELVAPAFMVEGPNGSVIVDPALASSEKAPVVEKPAGDRPAGLPEKFKSWEDMAKSYAELEQKLGTGKTDAVTPPATPAITPADAAAKGIDLAKLSVEFNEKGVLSPESLADLATKGITKDQVDAYVAGQKAVAAQLRTDLASVAGGEEQLSNVLQWAQTNLSEAETAAYNGLIDSGNTIAAKITLQGIVARYTESVGNDPSLIVAESTPSTSGIKPYGSQAEMVRDMQNPKYHSDEAWRQKVMQRLSVTTAF